MKILSMAFVVAFGLMETPLSFAGSEISGSNVLRDTTVPLELVVNADTLTCSHDDMWDQCQVKLLSPRLSDQTRFTNHQLTQFADGDCPVAQIQEALRLAAANGGKVNVKAHIILQMRGWWSNDLKTTCYFDMSESVDLEIPGGLRLSSSQDAGLGNTHFPAAVCMGLLKPDGT